MLFLYYARTENDSERKHRRRRCRCHGVTEVWPLGMSLQSIGSGQQQEDLVPVAVMGH